jgi:hypothetical protein
MRRLALIAALALAIGLGATAVAPGSGSTILVGPGPGATIRVGPTRGFSVIGTGFRPKVLVTLRVIAPGLDRRVTVRAGVRGGFTLRLPGLARCEPRSVTARAANGAGARIPVTWFVRECPPPPPLQPGLAGA